jgi:lipid A 3-O-deacylase PagL
MGLDLESRFLAFSECPYGRGALLPKPAHCRRVDHLFAQSADTPELFFVARLLAQSVNMRLSLPRGRFPVRLRLGAVLFVAALYLPAAQAQSRQGGGPQKPSREVQVWTGGGHSAYRGARHTSVWNAGFRYGWIVTDAHGPGFFRGRLEYAVDVVPVFLVLQPSGAVYGAGLNPIALKWNLDVRGRVAPYFEIGVGTLFTHDRVPPGTSRVNFISSGALGVNVPQRRTHCSAEVRYMHISNASLTGRNRGLNIIQLRIGLGWFSRRG